MNRKIAGGGVFLLLTLLVACQASGAVVTKRWGPATAGKNAQILPCQGGEGVVHFELAGLPPGVRIHRADLLATRTSPVTGRDEDALTNIEIYPQFAAFRAGAAPQPEGKPLELRGPWFDRFDATDAVRQWAAGTANGGFFVKIFPRWSREATCLDITYEGQPENVPPQVTGLKVFHRAGQTFLTWKEIEDVVGRDEIQWRELKLLLENLDQTRQVRYVVYRSDEPIGADSLHAAEPIARLEPLSCWNVNGRNVERPIDQVIATEPVLRHGAWNPFGEADPDGQYGLDCPIDRLVVEDGGRPLPRATGLYVHTPGQAGRAYYAVVTSVDGVENTMAFSSANATAEPVVETAGAGEPVLQGVLPDGPLWNYRQKRLHYVRWVSPPLCNLPSRYYNWSVGVPLELAGRQPRQSQRDRVPLELNLHRDSGSYWRTQYRLERDSIVLRPHDFPLRTWWYGYHECRDTLKSFRQGCIHNYTERRLLAFLEWAGKKWPVDQDRILVTGVRWSGGSGALRLGLRNPDVFNLVLAGHAMPELSYLITDLNEMRRQEGRFNPLEQMWGKIELGLPTDEGENVWDALNLNRYVAALPAAAELPLVGMTSDSSWKPAHRFYGLMLARREAILANFTWGGQELVPVSAESTWPNAVRQEVRRNRLMLAFKGGPSSKGETIEDVLAGGRGAEFNWSYRWNPETVVDEPDRCEVTVYQQRKYGGGDAPQADVTFRRLQHFKVQPGRTYRWAVTPLPGKEEPAPPRREEPLTESSGEITVGEDGLLTIPNVKIGPGGSRLAVTPK